MANVDWSELADQCVDYVAVRVLQIIDEVDQEIFLRDVLIGLMYEGVSPAVLDELVPIDGFAVFLDDDEEGS